MPHTLFVPETVISLSNTCSLAKFKGLPPSRVNFPENLQDAVLDQISETYFKHISHATNDRKKAQKSVRHRHRHRLTGKVCC